VAGLAAVGALTARPAMWMLAALVAAAVAVVSCMAGRPLPGAAWWLGVALLAAVATSWGAASGWRGLDRPVPTQLDDRVVLTADPRPVTRGVRVEARSSGRLYDLYARGAAAGTIGGLRVGESVRVVGKVRPRLAGDRWRASRHVAGTVEAVSAEAPRPARGFAAMANAVHRTVDAGAASLGVDGRGVLLGVAVGDRGALAPLVTEDLRAAGLAHLTAVSGQHVAIVMALVSPVLRRLRGSRRTVLTLVVLAGFALVTRGEPSVLRAVVMASVVELARQPRGLARGRMWWGASGEVRGMRALATAVTVLLVVDPLMVWSLAFQLSVAATAGIALGASRLAQWMPGPRPVAQAMAVGACAQLAVAPLLVTHIGPVPIHGVLATALAAPAVAGLLGWGLTVGLLAGVLTPFVPAAVPAVLHLPSAALSWWVLFVAEFFARLPAAHAGASQLAAVLVAVTVALAVHHRRVAAVAARVSLSLPGIVRKCAVGAVAVVVVMSMATGSQLAPGRHELTSGAALFVGSGPDAPALVLDGRSQPASVLAALRNRGVRSVRTVVVRTPSPSAAATAELLRQRLGAAVVLTPDLPSTGDPFAPRTLRLDPGELVLRLDGDRLEVTPGPEVAVAASEP
jgi:competence protein ComEC